MSIADILTKSLKKDNRQRVINIAQYYYQQGRIHYSTFLYIMTKPAYLLE